MASSYSESLSSTGRRAVDDDLVKWLFKYATYSPECHPLFRRYLRDVVLGAETVGQDIEIQAKNVDYCLRNWEIRDWYTPGEEFWDNIGPYDIYDFLNPPDQVRRVLPRPPHIPDQYNPSSYGKKAIDDFEGFKSDGEEEKDSDYGIVRKKGRSTTDPVTEEQMPEPRRKQKEGPIIRSRDDHLELLDEIPMSEIKGPEGNLRQIPPLSDQSGDDWTKDSIYRGKRQPPLGIRLKTIVNFLCDDDCDRGIGWKNNFDDAVDYLHWLALEDKSKQIWKASSPVLGMFEDAVDKAKTHVLFEKHHYDPTPVKIPKPPKVPSKTTRLDHLGDVTNWPVPNKASSASKTKTLTPRAIHPRPVTDTPEGHVNNLLSRVSNSEDLRNALERHEASWWNRRSPDPGADERNMSLIEAQTFDTFSQDDLIGWTRPDRQTSLPVLPDGRRIPLGDAFGWVRQRGAHRAGLQQILRITSTFTDKNSTAGIPRRKLVLPNSASTIQEVRQKANGPQYIAPRLPPADYPGEIETMPYTIIFKRYLETVHAERTEALAKLFIEKTHDRTSVLPPKNVITGGPYIFRNLTHLEAATEDLLERCMTTLKLLEIASDRYPRQLLSYVLYYAKQALEGAQGAATGSVPHGLELASDEVNIISSDGQDRTPQPIKSEDMSWLRFLATECTNKTQILWSEFFGGDIYEKQKDTKYRLYHVFKTRVQRLLNDKNPWGIFSQADARVSVVDLLKEINQPSQANSTDTFHYTFEPHDACCWLDRMQRSGLIRFRPSPINYGVVQRPSIRLFPEHRVLWPKPEEGRPRPSYLSHIMPWKSVVKNFPTDAEGEKIANFFSVLGFRLGYTIYLLTNERERKTASQRELESAIKEFEDPRVSGGVGDDRLATLVQDVNLEDARKLFTVTEQTQPGRPAITRPLPPAQREEKALDWIRKKIIDEVSENLTMLGPGRDYIYFDPAEDEHILTRKFDFSWDCVTPTLPSPSTGVKHKQFWSLNRWPLDAGYLSKQALEEVKSKVVHKKQIFDPVEADKTDKSLWNIPQSKRITLDDNLVKFKPGPASYVRGDTKYQRRKIEREITKAANKALGIDTRRPRTWGQILADLNPFSTAPEKRDSDDEDDDDLISSSDNLSLPSVRKEDIPQSWDLEAEKWRQLGVVPLFRDDDYQGEGGLSDIDEEDTDEDEDEGGWGWGWGQGEDEQPRSGSRLSRFVNDTLGLDRADDFESESDEEQGGGTQEGSSVNNEAAESEDEGEDEDSDVSIMEI